MKTFFQWQENLAPLSNDVKHMIGNPIFAIETNLEPLKKRISMGRTDEALQIVSEIEVSIRQINDFLSKISS